jgi:hypothetical protein
VTGAGPATPDRVSSPDEFEYTRHGTCSFFIKLRRGQVAARDGITQHLGIKYMCGVLRSRASRSAFLADTSHSIVSHYTHTHAYTRPVPPVSVPAESAAVPPELTLGAGRGPVASSPLSIHAVYGNEPFDI